MDRPVRAFFGFTSIDSSLGMTRAEAFAAEHRIGELRPILYAGLLDRIGGFGAGEDPRRRAAGRVGPGPRSTRASGATG